MNEPTFTAHNIRLSDGRLTKPGTIEISDHPWYQAAEKIIRLVFPKQEDLASRSIVDFGCLEGGYTVEFARIGLKSLGVELNDLNFEACEYVKKNLNLTNLVFKKMNVMDVRELQDFDIAFVCGILYHLDQPLKFLEDLATRVRKLVIIQTHFSLDSTTGEFNLSEMRTNEGVRGRWFSEFDPNDSIEQRKTYRWAASGNSESFWIRREDLIGKLYDLGFDCVLEQFDSFNPNVTDQLVNGYPSYMRGTFIGIKSGNI
jgi:SAM-dependent methyltransferase